MVVQYDHIYSAVMFPADNDIDCFNNLLITYKRSLCGGYYLGKNTGVYKCLIFPASFILIEITNILSVCVPLV